MNNNMFAKLFLRMGLAFVFVYAAVEIYFHPDNFLKYIPSYALSMLPIDTFLLLFGIVEIAIAVWLLSGWKGVYPAMLSVLMITGIVVCNMEYFQILFRNVAIAFGALALAVLEFQRKEDRSFLKRLWNKAEPTFNRFRKTPKLHERVLRAFK